MDGIFGVGLAEMIIIGLVLFIVGGPRNSAKWAREAGRTMRKVRRSWDQMMAEFEKELGPDGKELMDVTRELSRSAQDLRGVSSPKRLLSETARSLDVLASEIEGKSIPVLKADTEKTSSNGQKYQAWLPPDKKDE
jgi:sec-independent protein translocase protein TatB